MATHQSNRVVWTKAGRTLTVCTADAFAISGIPLKIAKGANRRVISSPRQLTARVA
jgi:hypothetical protein